ncbi:hypothetical protein JT358_10245 [Micrococcales bacterium 31B]|nr:hypothetical protein [Micrococcales bacterium 31B]
MSHPSAAVLAAFGVPAGVEAHPLEGGQGNSWRAGPLVLKPVAELREGAWRAELFKGLDSGPDLRIPRPARARVDGAEAWHHDGWEAWGWLAGRPNERRLRDVLAAGESLHSRLRGVAPPEFLYCAAHPWARADRIAWGESRHDCLVADEFIAGLAAARRDVTLEPQLVHGDLLGNVLFHEVHAPAVIDFSPYYRPTAYAAAIACVDAVCWHRHPAADLGGLAPAGLDAATWGQMLVRALLFRLATFHTMAPFRLTLAPALIARHEPCAHEALRLAGLAGL